MEVTILPEEGSQCLWRGPRFALTDPRQGPMVMTAGQTWAAVPESVSDEGAW